jgi:hypothetical protein
MSKKMPRRMVGNVSHIELTRDSEDKIPHRGAGHTEKRRED